MRQVNGLRTAGVILFSSLLVMGMQGVALARGHGGFGGGGGHVGGFAGRGFGGHVGFAGHGFGHGIAGRGFGRSYGGRSSPGRGFNGGRGGYGRGGYGRYGYGRYGHGGWGGYGGWGWGAGLGLGLWLSVLPWDYETLWWDGLPYYYADDAYYTWDPQADEYQQVQPPPQVTQEATEQPPEQARLFAYPKNGQSEQQQATDKVQCRTWARGQSGYNPADAASVAAPTGVTPAANALSTSGTAVSTTDTANGIYHTVGSAPAAAQTATPVTAAANGAVTGPPGDAQFAKRDAYLRAEGACLTGRGYSVD